MTQQTAQALLDLLDGRRGHFHLESGHHGELWLDLDALFLRPARLTPFVADLAERVSGIGNVDAVCGPLFGGALVASAVAATLDCELYVAEQVQRADDGSELYAARYEVPQAIRGHLRGRRVAVIDDVINAGSATRATVADLRAAGAEVVAIGALLVLGSRVAEYAAQEGFELVRVAAMEQRIWEPASCPLCAAGEPLEDVAGHASEAEAP
jgi:orotate phosphoribosyltransferase